MKDQVAEIKRLNVYTAKRRAYQFAYNVMIGAYETVPKGRYPISRKSWDELFDYAFGLGRTLPAGAQRWQMKYQGEEKPAPQHDAAEMVMEATDPQGKVIRLAFVPTK